jgi:hypothetical protein
MDRSRIKFSSRYHQTLFGSGVGSNTGGEDKAEPDRKLLGNQVSGQEWMPSGSAVTGSRQNRCLKAAVERGGSFVWTLYRL